MSKRIFIGHRILTSCIVILFLILVPFQVYADDMSGIAYLFFVWPIGLLFLLSFLILGVISLVKLLKKKYDKTNFKYARLVIILNIVMIIIFSILVVATEIYNDLYKRNFNWSSTATFSLVVVGSGAVICLLLGILLLIKSRQK
ncbi:MAG: hypothetical protein IEMM0008_0432 [bacterium]|nr:MAG: hypothetical protein IEMM0008_0432 [bacterium]